MCFLSFLSSILSLFFSDIDIRKNEKLLLQKAGYVQSLNSSLTTIVPTLATILTFIVHTALKLPLQPSTVSAKKKAYSLHYHSKVRDQIKKKLILLLLVFFFE